MRTAPLIILLLLCGQAIAQDDIRLFKPTPQPADSSVNSNTGNSAVFSAHSPKLDSLFKDTVRPGTITVVESGSIKALMADYAANKRPLEGYRIQIFIGGRDEAESTRRTFLMAHPDIPAYLSYLAPNFRVRVGDLRDRIEAESMRTELKDAFPGLYVVPDEIEPPRLSTTGN